MNILFLVLSYCDLNIRIYCHTAIWSSYFQSCHHATWLYYFWSLSECDLKKKKRKKKKKNLPVLSKNSHFGILRLVQKYSFCHIITWIKISLSCHIVTWLNFSQSYELWLDLNLLSLVILWLDLNIPVLSTTQSLELQYNWLSIFGLVRFYLTLLFLDETNKHDFHTSGLVITTWPSYFWSYHYNLTFLFLI